MSAERLIIPASAILDVPTGTAEAKLRRDNLLRDAGTIATVGDRLDSDCAIEVLRSLEQFIREVEKEKDEVKAPALTFTRSVDSLTRDLLTEVRGQADRLSRLCGTFEAAERRKAEEARVAAVNEAARIAFEAAKATAQALRDAPTIEAGARAADAIAGEAQTEIIAVKSAVITAPKAANSQLRGTVKLEVQDIRALYAAEPNLVTLEPNGAAIRAIIKANPEIKLPGLTHWIDEKLNLR